MAIEVFNRYENKYMLDDKTCNSFQQELTHYMELDAYNRNGQSYTISNLYYDTPDDHLIRTSLSKPKYKEKLRIRAYGVPTVDSKVYVEVKKKVNGLVNKRRSALTLGEVYSFLTTNTLPEKKSYQNSQVLHEIEYLLQIYSLAPTLYLSYERNAYFDKENHGLRISFDNHIYTRRYDLRLESGNYGEPLLENGKYLMEIKSAGNIPLWLTRLLSAYNIYPIRFSKYGAEYAKMIACKHTQPVYQFIPDLSKWILPEVVNL